MTQQQINNQTQGHAQTLSEANGNINASRKNTPDGDRCLYRSKIKYEAGGYKWSWELK